MCGRSRQFPYPKRSERRSSPMLAGKALMHRFSLLVAPMKRDLKLDYL